MIVKNMDEHSVELATIDRLLLSDPSDSQADSLERDKRAILSALQHKRDAAYHLDFYFAETDDWVVFHDLHLQMGELEATFDHLLINREMDVFVIETRHYNSKVRVNEEKEFIYYVENRPVPVESPAERNRENIEFLESYMVSNSLLPTRFGLAIRPNFHNIVLISPTTSVQLPKGGIDLGCSVMRADVFLESLRKKPDTKSNKADFVALARQVSTENLHGMAEKLAQRHIPQNIDFRRRYGLESGVVADDISAEGVEQCAGCSKRITARVVRYCYDNHDLFAGKAYCFECQKGIAFKAVM